MCLYVWKRAQKMRREASHMAVGYTRLYCLGKLITLSIDRYEIAGLQMFTCWCFKKLAKSISKHLKDKNQASIQLKTSEKKPLKGTYKKEKKSLDFF